MARSFLPALRGASSKALGPVDDIIDGTIEPDYAVEGKSLSINGTSGVSFASVTNYGTTVYGYENRADAWDMNTVITEGYERAIWVYRCVELISGDLAGLPFRAAKDRGTPQEEVLEHHSLYRVLNKRANPLERAKHFRKRVIALLLLSKRGVFVEVIKSRAGNIVRLDILDSARCKPIPDDEGDGYVKHFEYIRRDGRVREIKPEHIRWIRHPHPTDPYSGTTPLEAAGLSVELDYLTRIYNSSFIKSDARPSGILGVDTDSLTDNEMDRLERKMQPGAHNAGQLTVIGTGPGGLSYTDTATKPRDMAYGEASSNAKVEILAAFGIGESMLGNASGRSFENTDAELYGYWTQVLPTHMEVFADAFDEDLPEGYDPYLDTSGVEVLQVPRRRDREEARTEVSQGLRSIDEYRKLAGLDLLDNAQSRAIWVSPAKAPIPGRPEDAAALGLGGPGAPGMPGEPGGMPPEGGPGGEPAPGEQPQGDAAAAVAALEAQIAGEGGAEGPADIDESAFNITDADIAAAEDAAPATGDAAEAVAAAQGTTDGPAESGDAQAAVDAAQAPLDGFVEGDAADAVRAARLEKKSLNVDVTRAALSVTAAIEATLARQVGVITARLESPKTRKGTKFWTAESPTDTRAGNARIDALKVVDAARWGLETAETLHPLLDAAATAEAKAILTALEDEGILVGGGTPEQVAGQIEVKGLDYANEAAMVVRSFLRDVGDVITDASYRATSIDEVTAEVKSLYAARAHDLATGVGQLVAEGAIGAACDAATGALLPVTGGPVTRVDGPRGAFSYAVPADSRLIAPL